MRSQPQSQSWLWTGHLGKLWVKARIYPLVPRCESSRVQSSCSPGKAENQGAKPRECSDFQSGMGKEGRDLSRATGNDSRARNERPQTPNSIPQRIHSSHHPKSSPLHAFYPWKKELLTPRGCWELGDEKPAPLYSWFFFWLQDHFFYGPGFKNLGSGPQ